MTVKLPALIPDRNSSSGFRVEYLSVEIDADLAASLTLEEETSPVARQMMRLAHDIRAADRERLGQLTWGDKDLIIKALKMAASLSRPQSNTPEK